MFVWRGTRRNPVPPALFTLLAATLALQACEAVVSPPPARLQVIVNVFGTFATGGTEHHATRIDLTFASGIPRLTTRTEQGLEARGARASTSPACDIRPGAAAAAYLRSGLASPRDRGIEAGTVMAVARIGLPVLGDFTLARWKWMEDGRATIGDDEFGLIRTESLDCAPGFPVSAEPTGTATLILPVTMLGEVQHGGSSREVTGLDLTKSRPGLRLGDDPQAVDATTLDIQEGGRCSVSSSGPVQFLRPGVRPEQAELLPRTRVAALILAHTEPGAQGRQLALVRRDLLVNDRGRPCGEWS